MLRTVAGSKVGSWLGLSAFNQQAAKDKAIAMQTYPAARQEEDWMSQQPWVDFRIGNFKFRCTRTGLRRQNQAKLSGLGTGPRRGMSRR